MKLNLIFSKCLKNILRRTQVDKAIALSADFVGRLGDGEIIIAPSPRREAVSLCEAVPFRVRSPLGQTPT
jgi:hypothetical protein